MLLQSFSLEKKVRFVTVLGLILLAGIGWFSYQSVSELFKPFDWITHTQEVLGKIGVLTNQLTNVQTSVRGYVLTGEEKYLRPYQTAIRDIPGTLAEITSETRDNPRQQTNLILLKLQIKTFSR
ncbi:MAG TPA: CHASE3 domain-containing protein, partial [bacterium]|nr:CHASE3 domain-containing protein [bacterium]